MNIWATQRDPSVHMAGWLAILLLAGCIGAAMLLGRVQPAGFEGTVLDVSKRVFALKLKTIPGSQMANALWVWRCPDGLDIHSKMFFAPVEKCRRCCSGDGIRPGRHRV